MTDNRNRMGTSRHGIRIVLRRLAQHELQATAREGASILVAGHHCEIRVGQQRARPHVVTVGGKQYAYRYTGTSWNFHAHGVRATPAPEFWLLLDVTDGALFVVPDVVLAPTLTLTRHIGDRAGRAKVHQYRDRYDLLWMRGEAA